MSGKSVISSQEMVGKIKAALDSRHSDETLLFARTDALGVNGFDDALERAQRYLEAGADALFIEAPRDREQMEKISAQFAAEAPLIHNLVEGGDTPIEKPAELEALGYRIALYPAALLHQFTPQAQRLLAHIRKEGDTRKYRNEMYSLSDMNRVLGADALLKDGQHYDAKS
jgi:2-methylisocitrate lyase-like PEP mutase family enzyme